MGDEILFSTPKVLPVGHEAVFLTPKTSNWATKINFDAQKVNWAAKFFSSPIICRSQFNLGEKRRQARSEELNSHLTSPFASLWLSLSKIPRSEELSPIPSLSLGSLSPKTVISSRASHRHCGSPLLWNQGG